MRRAATMYGQSCREVGRGGGGSPAVWGGLPLLGVQRDLPQPPVRGDPPGPLGPLGKAIHRPTKALVAAADGEQRVQGLAFPRAPEVGRLVRLISAVVYLLPYSRSPARSRGSYSRPGLPRFLSTRPSAWRTAAQGTPTKGPYIHGPAPTTHATTKATLTHNIEGMLS